MEGGVCGRKQKLQYTLRINIAALECSFSEKMRDITLNVNNIKTKKSILLIILCHIGHKGNTAKVDENFSRHFLCGLASF